METGGQIAESKPSTAKAVAANCVVARTINDVSAIASSIGAAVEAQGSATAEIARNVAAMANSTQEVTVHIKDGATP